MSTWSVIITSIISVLIVEFVISLTNKYGKRIRLEELKKRSTTVGVFAYREPIYYDAIQVDEERGNTFRVSFWAKQWGIVLSPVASDGNSVFKFIAINQNTGKGKMLEYQAGDWFILDGDEIKVIRKADFAKEWRMG